MNAIYRLSATLTMAVLAMSVFAQQHIGKAIDKFLQDKKSHEYIISNNKNNEYVPEAGKNAMFHEIRFRLIRADIDKLERLRKAFLNDSGKAYFIMMKDAGSGSGETCNIAYGADISKSYNCPLAFVVRKRLRRMGIKRGFKVVFSEELPDRDAIVECDDRNKKSQVGTISYVPAVFGCVCAQAALVHLCRRNG